MRKLYIVNLIGVLILGLFHLPYWLLGENSFVLVHDNLDCEFVYLTLLKDAGLLFGFSVLPEVEQVMLGLPRVYFHSEFSFIRLMYYFFDPLTAYVLNSWVVRIIGFVGMSLFIKDLYKDVPYSVLFLFSLAYASLSIYSLYGLTIMGLPLIFWAGKNLMENRKLWASLIVFLLFPFYAHFAMIAPFVLCALVVVGLYRSRIEHSAVHQKFIFGIALLTVSFIAANFLSISNFLTNTELSHRTEWQLPVKGPMGTVKEIFRTFFFSQYHGSPFIAWPIFLAFLWTLFKGNFRNKRALHLIIALFIICVFHGIYSYFAYALRNVAHIFTSFQFNRFTMLIPMLWMTILILWYMNSTLNEKGKKLMVFLVLIMVLGRFTELKMNYKLLFKMPNHENVIGYQDFFSSHIFDEIDQYIAKDKSSYRIANLGIPPAVAQYNGFYTIDSYQNNYPLTYKERFRNIIGNELAKSDKMKASFENWGSYCYIMSAELYDHCRYSCQKSDSAEIVNLELNIGEMKAMGTEYLISAVEIRNYLELELSFEGLFGKPEDHWSIYLYRL